MFSCFGKGSSSSQANDEAPTDPPQVHHIQSNLNHFRGDKSISLLSSLLNLANLAARSDVLFQSWEAILETKDQFSIQLSRDPENVQCRERVLQKEKYNIIAFVTSPITKSRLLDKTELVVSTSESPISGFDFLHSPRIKAFSINETAFSLFNSREVELSEIIDQIIEDYKPKSNLAQETEPKPYVITGDGVGGAVASLFTLRLLSKLDALKAKPTLCITFGSPLLGDSGFQKGISSHTTWKSRFLHLVSMDDCFPSLFVQPNHPTGGQTTNPASTYHPFGRFMFCSNSGGACFEDPESALDLLGKMRPERGDEESFDYNSLIANLRKGLICNDKTNLNAHGTGSSSGTAHVAAQYLAGLFQLQNVARKSQLLELLEKEMFVLNEKGKALGKKAKDLNDIKISMVYLEWYKKISEKHNTPYYDSYKNQLNKPDFYVSESIGQLQEYWERLVNEAAESPQKEGEALRKRYLLGGTTYRKLAEPLAIADYYRSKGAKNYITEGRSDKRLKHYEALEQWFKEGPANKNRENRNAPPSLTDDSRFWAHVEEAKISCHNVIQEESTSTAIEMLMKFEEYVFERITNYEVSSDIFLERSSFMKWWEDYKRILDQDLMGTSYASPLAKYIHDRTFSLYENGELFH